jgi:hypothetical protein
MHFPSTSAKPVDIACTANADVLRRNLSLLLAAGAESSVEEIGRLALLHSTQRRFSRTHMNTVNMSVEVRCAAVQ